MTTPRSTYYNYTYRSDGVKMREQSTHQYTKLVMKISASGDTTYVQRNASDTHFRAHYGNYVKETGMPDKIYNEEGYIALHGDSVSYHFFERDYLGSVRAVFDLYGNLEQTNDYNVTGIPSSRHLGNADPHKHTGKEFQGFNGLSWYDNQARYYDPILARFTTQDPLAEKYPWLSPYNHCANNPLKFIDPDGQKVRVNNDYNKAVSNYAQIAATQMGNKILSYLENQGETYSLNSTFWTISSSYNPQNRTISYVGTPWLKKVPNDGGYLNSMVAMGHELLHAYDHALGLLNKNNINQNYLEPRAISFGNYLRQAFSLQPLREKYSNIKGDFHQNFGNDKITNLINLDSNNNKYGYSFDRTQYNYVIGSNGLPRLINKVTNKFYMIINIDDNNNITHQIYNSKSEYEKNWQISY